MLRANHLLRCLMQTLADLMNMQYADWKAIASRVS